MWGALPVMAFCGSSSPGRWQTATAPPLYQSGAKERDAGGSITNFSMYTHAPMHSSAHTTFHASESGIRSTTRRMRTAKKPDAAFWQDTNLMGFRALVRDSVDVPAHKYRPP